MDPELDQITQAILIASDPSQAPLHAQALEYISSIQQNAQMTWRWALALFVEPGTEGGVRKYPPQVRFFALRVLEDFLDSRLVGLSARGCLLNFLTIDRFDSLEPETFKIIQEALVKYIQSEYIYGPAEASSPCASCSSSSQL